MSRSALGGFVSGLQGGMQFRQDSLRNRRIDKALDFELERIERAQRGADAAATAESGDDAILTRSAADMGLDDPYGGFAGKLAQWGQSAWKGITSPFRREGMADGGEVSDDPYWPRAFDDEGNRLELSAEDRMKRSYGPYYVTEQEAADNRDRRTRGDYYAIGPVERTRAGVDEQRLAASRSGGGALEFGRDYGRALGVGQDSPREAGEQFRRSIGEGIGQTVDAGGRALDATRRVVGDAIGPALDFAGGVVGTPEGEAIQASDVAAQPQPDAPAPTQGQTSRPNEAASSGGVTPAGGTAPARQAVPTQSQQGFDWSSVEAMPDDMPTMNTRDWQDYRKKSVAALMAQGMTANEAHEQVTQLQQRGFLDNAQQAFQFMQMGDVRSASLALKAAYQYFPNGSDVRFGMTQDSQGQPALVAMGADEETGEQKGNPMLINSERLAVMMENMSNPSAFRSWTKDWRTEEFERQIYEEYTKPIGEANAQTSRINARANEMNAQRALQSGGRGGLRQSDLDRAYSAMNEILSEMGLMEDIPAEDMSYLRQIAAIAYEQSPGNYLNTVEQLASIYRQGGTQAVDAAIRGGE